MLSINIYQDVGKFLLKSLRPTNYKWGGAPLHFISIFPLSWLTLTIEIDLPAVSGGWPVFLHAHKPRPLTSIFFAISSACDWSGDENIPSTFVTTEMFTLGVGKRQTMEMEAKKPIIMHLWRTYFFAIWAKCNFGRRTELGRQIMPTRESVLL